MQRRRLILRRIGGSLFITVPSEILRTYGLRVGDAIEWELGADEAKVRFFKVTTSVTPAERAEDTAEAAAAG
jgi:antitoxin component of MazEF toxin-antitoxin module